MSRELVPIDSLLCNRYSLSRKIGFAGHPIMQMVTHVPSFERIASGENVTWEELGYAYIKRFTQTDVGNLTVDDLREFFSDVKRRGVQKLVTAWKLHKSYELFGGHHRVIAAKLAGQDRIYIDTKPLDPVKDEDAILIRQVYSMIWQQKELGLSVGRSYNPVCGLNSIRNGLDRLQIIYEELIRVRGMSLLDLGCNDGYFGIALSEHDFSVVFVDRSVSYLNVVEAKSKLLETNEKHTIVFADVSDFLKGVKLGEYNAILYMDVFYHTAMEKGIEAAVADFRLALNLASERLIFAPGRWDKLVPLGFTEARMIEIVMEVGRRIKYLGSDGDGPGYGRQIYVIY
jgi:16S rRNA G966 N2-methylase RsmD